MRECCNWHKVSCSRDPIVDYTNNHVIKGLKHLKHSSMLKLKFWLVNFQRINIWIPLNKLEQTLLVKNRFAFFFGYFFHSGAELDNQLQWAKLKIHVHGGKIIIIFIIIIVICNLDIFLCKRLSNQFNALINILIHEY